MRPIKFRAYNRDWNMTLPVDEIKFENGEAVSVSVTIKASDYDHKGEWEDYIVGDEITIEQFTGLKDKNGKEIYEGDIITNYGVTKEMKTRRYEVVFTEDRARFSAYDLSSKWNTSMSSYDMKQCKVIGNKYENPELLN